VELRSCDPEDHADYRIALLEVRNSTDQDVRRVTAQRASEEANRLIQVKPPDREEALKKAKVALDMWVSIGDPLEEARAFLAVGTMYQDSGKPKEALEMLEQGLRVADTAKLVIEQASIRREVSAVLSGAGKIDQAMEYASQARQISMANSLDKKGVAEGWIAEGYAQYLKSRMDDAADSYKNAFNVFETLQYRRGQAQALWNMAIVDLVRQRFSDAQEWAGRSQTIFDKLHDEVGRAKSSIVIGEVLSVSTDRHQEALDLLLPAKDILQNAGDLEGEAVALNSIAQVYIFLHDCETALPYSKEALDKLIRTGNQVAESVDLHLAGYCYYELGEFADARSYLERARLGFHLLGDERIEARCLTDLAMVQLEEGDIRAAENNLNTVLKMNLTLKDKRLEASVKLALGRIREGSDRRAALQLYKESLQLYRSAEHPPGEISALYYLARHYSRAGDFGESMTYSKSAIEIIEKLRTSIASSGLQTLYFASAQQHYNLFIDSLMHMPGGASGPYAVNAFEWSERARARTLLDNIRQSRISISEGVDRTLAARLASIWSRIDSKSEELAGVAPGTKQRAALNEELRTLYSEYDELQSQLRKKDPHYAAVLKPQPLTLPEIQKKVVVDNQTLLLEYVLGDDCSYLFVVTDKAFFSFQLPSRSVIEGKVVGLRNMIIARSVSPESPDYSARVKKADQDYPAAVADLSELLLGPVADRLGGSPARHRCRWCAAVSAIRRPARTPICRCIVTDSAPGV
jgi:tetratricopeptide (TPR) repeat protein